MTSLDDTTNFIVTYVVKAGDTVATITRVLATAMKNDSGNSAKGVLVVYDASHIYLNRKDPTVGTIRYFGVVGPQPGSDLTVTPGTETPLDNRKPTRFSPVKR